ncbi:MAG TPA: citrate synthase [Burkholderiales bacterium]
MAWLTARQALAALEVRTQTLYANVSRGRIRARPDPADSRRSLYHSEDVKRLARRRAGRRTVEAVAAQAIGWGDPVLASGISTVVDGRLWYRGRDAVALARSATLEQAAALLWEVETVTFVRGGRAALPAGTAPGLAATLAALSRRVAADPPSRGHARAALVTEAVDLLGDVITAMLGPAPAAGLALHLRVARAWRAPAAQDLIRRALVLLADHELNASTFAARVAASTGAPLAAGLMAGLVTLAGPLHGGAAAGMRALIEAARRDGAAASVRAWLEQGHALAAFGHPLYPEGDPRAAALFEYLPMPRIYAEVRDEVAALIGEAPNIDFALCALADRYALPADAPFTIFALARSVGWTAHALEQAATGQLIRPRARYTGPPPQADATPAPRRRAPR